MHRTASHLAQLTDGSVMAMAPARHRDIGLPALLALAALAALSPIACAADADAAEDGSPPLASSGDGAPGPAVTASGGGPGTASSEPDAAPLSAAPDPNPPADACALAGPPALGPDPVLVWSDEFDGAALDETKWIAAEGYQGHGTIVNVFERRALSVHDGSLFVTTRAAPEYPTRPYASGRIGTHGRFVRTYGRVEIRARFARAPGVWYALWARPWNGAFPEIDFELLSRSTMQVYAVNHWAAPPLPADERRMYVLRTDIDFTAFHVYTVVWTPGLLEWRVDGAPMMRSMSKGVPKEPVGWMINAWVGGWSGGPTAETPIPSTFEVDYIRVYRDGGLLADPALRVMDAKAKYVRAKDRVAIEVANFDEACSHVRMYDGDALVRTLAAPPWRFDVGFLSKGAHSLRFVGTDGVRSAETSVDVALE